MASAHRAASFGAVIRAMRPPTVAQPKAKIATKAQVMSQRPNVSCDLSRPGPINCETPQPRVASTTPGSALVQPATRIQVAGVDLAIAENTIDDGGDYRCFGVADAGRSRGERSDNIEDHYGKRPNQWDAKSGIHIGIASQTVRAQPGGLENATPLGRSGLAPPS